MVIRENGGLGVEFVEIGSLDNGIAVAGEIAIALVIGDDDDDIGARLARGHGNEGQEATE